MCERDVVCVVWCVCMCILYVCVCGMCVRERDVAWCGVCVGGTLSMAGV